MCVFCTVWFHRCVFVLSSLCGTLSLLHRVMTMKSFTQDSLESRGGRHLHHLMIPQTTQISKHAKTSHFSHRVNICDLLELRFVARAEGGWWLLKRNLEGSGAWPTADWSSPGSESQRTRESFSVLSSSTCFTSFIQTKVKLSLFSSLRHKHPQV